MCMMMLAAMDTTIVSTAIPQIVGDLGGLRLVSWVFSIYVLAQTVTIPVYGKLADLFGRKPVLIAGTVVFLIGSAACSLAWNMRTLIIFRGVQGLAAGAVMATVNTLAGDLYSVKERAAVQGWLSSVWGMAAIVGPLLGGAFADYVSWRWIFLVNLPVGAVALGLIGVFLHESFERRHPRIDWIGSLLVLLALGALIFGLLQGGQAWAWASTRSLALAAFVALMLACLVWVERRAAEPIMPGWLWRQRAIAGANVVTLGLGLAMMAPMIYLPTLLQSVQGLGAIAAGLVLASLSLGWPVASAMSGRIYLRIGFRDTALIGVGLMFLAALGFILMPRPQPVWLVVLDQVLLGAGFGLTSTPLLVGQQAMVGWSQRGVVTGSNMFSRYLGQSLGAAMFGAIFNAAVAGRIGAAPAALQQQLPGSVDTVIDVLHASELGATAHVYLQETVMLAMHHLYVGVAIAALVMLGVLLAVPRRFAMQGVDSAGGSASVGGACR